MRFVHAVRFQQQLRLSSNTLKKLRDMYSGTDANDEVGRGFYSPVLYTIAYLRRV